MSCFYFTTVDDMLRRGKERDGERARGKKEKLGITNKDKCLHITELKIGLMT